MFWNPAYQAVFRLIALSDFRGQLRLPGLQRNHLDWCAHGELKKVEHMSHRVLSHRAKI